MRTVRISATAIIMPEKPRPTIAMRGTAEICAAAFALPEKVPEPSSQLPCGSSACVSIKVSTHNI